MNNVYDVNDDGEFNIEGIAFLIASQFPFESEEAARAICQLVPSLVEAGLENRRRRFEPKT